MYTECAQNHLTHKLKELQPYWYFDKQNDLVANQVSLQCLDWIE